jgi:hypothetical protein
MCTQAFDVEVGLAAMDVIQGACHVPYVPRPLAILADVTPILWYDLRAYVDGVRAHLLSLFLPSFPPTVLYAPRAVVNSDTHGVCPCSSSITASVSSWKTAYDNIALWHGRWWWAPPTT